WSSAPTARRWPREAGTGRSSYGTYQQPSRRMSKRASPRKDRHSILWHSTWPLRGLTCKPGRDRVELADEVVRTMADDQGDRRWVMKPELGRMHGVVWLGVACLWLLPLSPLSAQQPKLRDTLKGHNSVVRSVAYSPDGKTLASGSWDYTAKLWDVASGK